MRIACVTMSISRRAIPSPLGLSRGRVAILSKTGWSARGCVGRSRVRKRCWTCAAPTLMGIGTTSCGIALRRKPNVCTRIAISSNQLKLLRRGRCRSRHEVAESSRSHPLAVVVGSVWIPLAAEFTIASDADNVIAPKLLEQLPLETRYILGDTHYNTPKLRAECALHNRELVATRRGPYPHRDGGVEVRRIFHKLRSLAIEPFNGLFKN